MIWTIRSRGHTSGRLARDVRVHGQGLSPGRSAQNGYVAALMAQVGFTAGIRGLEGPRGFAAVTAARSDLTKITDGLGLDFDLRANTYKPFPCGIVNHPTIDGCIQLHEAHHIAPEQIASVRLRSRRS
jgi:2-methylcitrate dehydratase PrpD